MSKDKDIEIVDDVKLNHQEEQFTFLLFEGKNQSEAFRIAYPNSLKWKPKTVWEKASVLANKNKVKKRLQQLKNPVIEKLIQHQEEFVETIIETNKAAKDKDNNIDYNTRLKAAKIGLDYLGYEAPQKNINLNVGVDLTKEEVDNLLKNL